MTPVAVVECKSFGVVGIFRICYFCRAAHHLNNKFSISCFFPGVKRSDPHSHFYIFLLSHLLLISALQTEEKQTKGELECPLKAKVPPMSPLGQGLSRAIN